MVRQSRSSLLAPFQERILALIFLRPERAWYRSELARELRCSASSLQRPLGDLVDSGILQAHRDGNRRYYQADTKNPIYPDLKGLLAKTAGLADVLREALGSLSEKIAIAFVYGSIAAGTETPASDVDLMIVGGAGVAELSLSVQQASMRLGREVNPAVYSVAEFSAKLHAQGSFLQAVVDKPKLFIIGSDNDIRRIAGSETS